MPIAYTLSNMVCHVDMEEDLAYQLTKIFWDNKAEMDAAFAPLAHLPKEAVQPFFDPGLEYAPVHPGAVKYYKEVGWVK